MTGNVMAGARAGTAVLDDAAIAELRAFNASFEQRLAATPPVESVPVSESRAAAREGSGTIPPPFLLPRARELLIPGRAGQIGLRVLAPEEAASGIYLHLHGDGRVLGERDLQDPLLWELAQATGLCVVSAGYRLARSGCGEVSAWRPLGAGPASRTAVATPKAPGGLSGAA